MHGHTTENVIFMGPIKYSMIKFQVALGVLVVGSYIRYSLYKWNSLDHSIRLILLSFFYRFLELRKEYLFMSKIHFIVGFWIKTIIVKYNL